MKYNILGLVAALAGFTLTGCSDEMPDGLSGAAQGDRNLELTIGAAYPTASRASDAGFEDGDRMGVYVVDYEGDDVAGIDSEGIRASNVRFTFNGSDNTWSAVTPVYWKDGKTPVDIVAYYPFVSEIDNPCRLHHSVSSRQDVTGSGSEMGGYESSDLLIAKAEKAMPTTERVDLTFRHAMAGLRISLQQGTGFADGEWVGLKRSVMINNVRPDVDVDLSTGNIEAVSGDPTNIITYEYADDYRAVVVPQTIAAGTDVVTVTVDGVTYRLVKDSAVTYTAGKLHIFTIQVDKRTSSGDYEFKLVDEAITAWIDDVEFRDGLMRQYVTVDVAEHGTLEECIAKVSADPSLIKNLKIRGHIDESDFAYIRDNMPIIGSLNLKEATCYYNNEAGIIPPGAMMGKQTLTHIIFPDNLREIRGSAFIDTGLIGDLILPEGLIVCSSYEVNWNGFMTQGAFMRCASLSGTLTLPSTLEIIGLSAFYSTPLSGPLRLPKSLRRIEGDYYGAFKNCKFSGDLILPENLEYVGACAFESCGLTGMLVIPQSLKEINSRAFVNCCSGTLVIPEGVTRIHSNAFENGRFRGELKLPSTLTYIGDAAFKNTEISGIVFGEKISYIGDECFAECKRLSGTITIPEKVTRISTSTFYNCTMLQEVVLHDEMLSLSPRAFGNCYNLEKIVSNNPEPPLISYDGTVNAFDGVPKDNFSLEVPQGSEDAYSRANGWKEFRRITAYSGFVCRPSAVNALGSAMTKELVIDADGDWTLEHKPDWCSLSATSGTHKTSVTLTINELSSGAENRTDSLVFSLDGTEFKTICRLTQYDYQYGEDEAVKLQSATRGNGIDIVFVGDGFDAKSISSGAYLAQVGQQMEYFFGLEPYATYRDYFNVYAIIALSQDTGVNTLSTYRDTRFMTWYGGSGTETSVSQLNVNDSDEVFDYVVRHSPVSTERLRNGLVIVSMNSDEYGGATYLFEDGRAISICSPSQDSYPNDSRGIVQHEAGGHGFGKLGDEMIRYNKFAPDNVKWDITSGHDHGWYRNLSVSGKITDVAWSHMINDPRYSNVVDIYEGGYGYTRGVYRSEINSCMNYSIPYYNAISRQAIVERILNNSGEGFSLEKFYANDSSEWGSTGGSRAAAASLSASGSHRPVTIVKDKIKRKIK